MAGGGMTKVAVLVAAMVVFLAGAKAMDLCNVTEDGLTACKPSVVQPNPVEPSPECCDAVVSGADLKCLCSYKNLFMLPSLGIDPDLALALPAKCNIPNPTEC
ncbi:hypothetical protein ABFS82_04G072100 [Erythranthe guttata]|uniref:Bifunctional inhibitor/plant lipid transfer protein/seed storage helical domain-containing protein n=1 Tax=Erythranthe guttata TaxID=4155 RepID=A0A022S1I9_ERYGU|nr:PREDICTED: putative lipid-transfer protein DIR1 [Erythranthe guttata]EYU46116.1 hypothetical protein MIMGU_mgv1a025642mg [Erythranthe guttata]|eukprot:XP_012836742.1 PREDICTED: putative lipid-transfer protein DIR1 [Erythranthe guttata]